MAELKVTDLTMEYKKGVKALDCMNYVFTPGVYGLLGPNGAGKSTLMNIMTDNLKPTSGKVEYEGIETRSAEYRRILGYVPQSQELYPSFRLQRFMEYMATLKGVDKNLAARQIPELLSFVNLSDAANKKLGTFSGGMKKRALIAQALLGNPQILILDEPTAGLDPKERIRIRNIISEVAFNRIVIIATHVVTDIEFIAKEILLLQQGRLIISKEPKELCREMEDRVYEVTCSETEWKILCKKYKVGNITKREESVVMRIISEQPLAMPDVRPCVPNLEDVYLYYFDEDVLYETNQ